MHTAGVLLALAGLAVVNPAGLDGKAFAGPTRVAAAAHAAARRPAAVVVTVARSGPPVPRSFLGLATEYASVPIYERQGQLFDRMLSLLKPPDGSPLLLRIGGLSADDSLWAPAMEQSPPPKAMVLTPSDIDQIGALVRAEHLRVILNLNLAADIPNEEAALAQAATRELPRGSIAAFEIGNEPDYYRFALRGSPAYYPASYSPARYTSRFRAYASALRQTAPGVPLAGPALANPVADYGYLASLASGDRGSVGMLTVHRYALSACAPPDGPLYPTITRLLRATASVGLANTLQKSVALARANHLPIRWDELNSVTCGGTLGVSDSFASALWATDTLFAALAAGVNGVNVEMRPTALNAPFYLTPSGVQSRPLLYGLVLFDRALGRNAHRARTAISEPASANIAAWAIRLGSRKLNIVLLNKGDSPETVVLRVPRAGAGTVQRLLAASIRTRSRVTLAGQEIVGAAGWKGRYRAQKTIWSRGGYRVTLPAFSGALVSFMR